MLTQPYSAEQKRIYSIGCKLYLLNVFVYTGLRTDTEGNRMSHLQQSRDLGGSSPQFPRKRKQDRNQATEIEKETAGTISEEWI